jgi:outer membrane lipoprotein SlyB
MPQSIHGGIGFSFHTPQEHTMRVCKPILGVVAVASALLAGCADPNPNYSSQPQPYSGYPTQGYPAQGYPQAQYYGVVDRIEVVRKDSPNVAGTIIGGIVGGLIGHQIGSGRGNTAATIAGAAGGAYAGNQIEGRNRAANETFRVTVRMDDGSMRTLMTDNITDLRTGDRVRLDGNNIYRA